MTITRLNTLDTFKQLQPFQSIELMNKSVKQHKKLISAKKHKNTYRLLDLISQYSCVYFGVSWLAINQMSNLLDISYKTTQRALDRLIEWGILKKYACKRASGDKRQTSNIYVIQPFENECDLPEVTDQEALISNSKSTYTDVTKEFSQKIDKEDIVKATLLAKIPKPLRILGYFFNAKNIYNHTGTIYKAKSKIDRTIIIEDYSEQFESTIKQVISSFKLGKVRNFSGVLYAAICSLCKSIKLKLVLTEVFDF